MPHGRLITFEGGEGTGKSTQIALLADALEAQGYAVRTLREPGATAVGEAVRAILLDAAHADMSPRAELLLYEAARAQLVDAVIRPALEAGEVVLLDRFYDSSTAYQGYGRGLPLAEVSALNGAATAGLVPDLTLVLDIDPEEGLRRATAHGGADRLESETLEFHRRVRAGYQAIAAAEPDRVLLIDADGTPDEVAERVRGAVADRLRTAGGPG